MRILAILFFFICQTAIAQVDSLKNAALIGQSNRNQKVGQGFQIGFIGSSDDTCQINTKLQIVPNAGADKLLTSNANGFATWQAPGFWKLAGNSGISAGINFIGTTDAANLDFRTNNTPRGYFSNTGKLVKLYGDSTVQKLGYQKAYVGTTGDLGPLLLGPTLRYYMDTSLPFSLGTALIRAGCNIADWDDSLVIDLLCQHPDYGAVWHAQLGQHRVDILLAAGAANGTGVVTDTGRFFISNALLGDTVFQVFTAPGEIGLQYKDGTQAAGKVLTSDANGNATWQNTFTTFDTIVGGNIGTMYVPLTFGSGGMWILHFYFYTTTTDAGADHANLTIGWNDGLTARSVTSANLELSSQALINHVTGSLTEQVIYSQGDGIAFSVTSVTPGTSQYRLIISAQKVN